MGRVERTQAVVDAFYKQHGPCCAGCDWWRWYNSVAGECIKTVPVSGAERFAMLGITGSSLPIGAGHIMTKREHFCGEFQDSAQSTDDFYQQLAAKQQPLGAECSKVLHDNLWELYARDDKKSTDAGNVK